MSLLSLHQNDAMTSFIPSTAPRSFTQNPQTTLHVTSTSPLQKHHAYALPNRRLPTASITMPSQKVRIYTKEDDTPVEKLASSLASAFGSDPVFLHIFGPNDSDMLAKRKTLLRSLLNLELSRPEGQTTVHVSEDDSTVAVWHHVNHCKLPFITQILFPLQLFRTVGWHRAIQFISTMDHVEQCHPTAPHMYLFIIGTDAAMQGKGAGSAVISKMLQHCDAHGIPAFLESSSERNLPFYIRHGFEVTKQIPNLPQDCPPIFALWREPKPVPDNLQD